MRGSGKLRRRLTRDHKNARANNRADAQRQQIQRPESAPQALFAFNLNASFISVGRSFLANRFAMLRFSLD